MRDLNELMGTYRPGYFEIYVNTDDEVDLNTLSEDRLSTFFHEWIHFLQDFTTGIGCNNSYARIEFLKSAGQLCKSQTPPVKLPVQVDPAGNVLVNAFTRLKEWGYSPVTPSFTGIAQTRNEMIEIPRQYRPSDSKIEIPICKATTDLGDDLGFGTAAIMESMAFECQRLVFPPSGPDGHPVYPYHVARLVAESIVPGFCDDPLRLIALCDMSLMSSAPGVQFTSFLMNIKKCSAPYPDSPEAVYDWFYLPKEGKIPILDAYREINDLARKSFLGILLDPDVFSDFRLWIDNAFGKALELRSDSPYFLLALLRGGELKKNRHFKNLLSMFGTPLLRNNKYAYTKIPLKGSSGWDVEYLQASWEVNDFLTNSVYQGCSLRNWCSASLSHLRKQGVPEDELIKPDMRCLKNPSERSRDTKLCPFALVWYAMGLPEAYR